MAVFGMEVIAVAKSQKNLVNLIQRKAVNIFRVIRRVDNHLMKVGNRVFVANYPNLPTGCIRLTRTNTIDFRARKLFIARTKNTKLINPGLLWLTEIFRSLRSAFGNNNPTIGSYIRNKFGHK